MNGKTVIGMFKEGADEVTNDMDTIVGRTLPTTIPPIEFPNPQLPTTPNPVSQGSILDFSSPVNTIVKSLFLISISPMLYGANDFNFLSVGCSAAILYSLFKLINR